MDLGLFGIVLLVLGAYALGISLLLLVGVSLGLRLRPQGLEATTPAEHAVEGGGAPAANPQERPRAARGSRRMPITEYLRGRSRRRIERSAAGARQADH